MAAYVEAILRWLQHSEGPWAYIVIGLATALEYLFPPVPGDTIALFGIFLAVSARYRVWIVYGVLDAGALVGGMSAYGVGRVITQRREGLPRFLRSATARAAIDRVLAGFARHGAMYLAINRFVPGLRAFFFVAAGMAKLPWWQVAIWGLVSASVWNAILVAIGWIAGDNFEQLARWIALYGYVAMGVVAIVGVAWGVRWWMRRRSHA